MRLQHGFAVNQYWALRADNDIVLMQITRMGNVAQRDQRAVLAEAFSDLCGCIATDVVDILKPSVIAAQNIGQARQFWTKAVCVNDVEKVIPTRF